MARVVLTFEDGPEGLEFTEDYSAAPAGEHPPTNAELLGAIVVKLVENMLGPSLEESGR